MADAGWYPDPEATGQARYWDGTGWTEHVQPLADPAAPPTPAQAETAWGGAAIPVAAAAPGPVAVGPSAPRSRRGLAAVLAVVALSAVGVAAFLMVRDDPPPSRSAGSRDAPGSVAASTTTTTVAPAPRDPGIALAQRSACLAEEETIRRAAVAYHAINGSYPTTNQQLLDDRWLDEAPKWYRLAGDGSVLRLTPSGPCLPNASN